MVQAAHLLSPYPLPLPMDTLISEVEAWFRRVDTGTAFLVNAEGSLVGQIKQRDIERACHHGFADWPVRTLMIPVEVTVTPETSWEELQSRIAHLDPLPVVVDGHWVGVIEPARVWDSLHAQPFQPFTYTRLPASQQTMIDTVTTVAADLNIELYVVGGAIRDVLLGRTGDDLDVDLVAVGRHEQADIGGAVVLGEAVQARDPRLRLEIHTLYQTVTLTWPEGTWIDIASARTESYAYPGAPPHIMLSSLEDDLARRDFTVNALALALTGAQAGLIVDQFHGQQDLQRRQLRILHPTSFIEDPTRIFRACRFVITLGFDLEPWTAAILETTLQSRIHDSRGGIRLRQEWEYLLARPTWSLAFAQLEQWGAWRCIHPQLQWRHPFIAAVRRVGAWIHYFQRWYPEIHPRHRVLGRMEHWLLSLPDALAVAQQLRLPVESIDRLRRLSQQEPFWLTYPLPPSQIDRQLQHTSVLDILVASASAPAAVRHSLYHYLRYERLTKPLLNGRDLKALGYPPGSLYHQILQHLRWAALDGEITTVADAHAYVRQHFPLP